MFISRLWKLPLTMVSMSGYLTSPPPTWNEFFATPLSVDSWSACCTEPNCRFTAGHVRPAPGH